MEVAEVKHERRGEERHGGGRGCGGDTKVKNERHGEERHGGDRGDDYIAGVLQYKCVSHSCITALVLMTETPVGDSWVRNSGLAGNETEVS